MSADVIQFGHARRERQAEQREREDAARGGFFTTKEFLANFACAPPETRLRVQSMLEAEARTQDDAQGPARCLAVQRPMTSTARNSHLRSGRRVAWRKADAATRYWRALLDFRDAASIAREHKVKDAEMFTGTADDRWALLGSYRAALGRQLLTAAPDMAAVIWKRQQLTKAYLGADEDDIAKAIAEDVAFLDAHPTRKRRPSA